MPLSGESFSIFIKGQGELGRIIRVTVASGPGWKFLRSNGQEMVKQGKWLSSPRWNSGQELRARAELSQVVAVEAERPRQSPEA